MSDDRIFADGIFRIIAGDQTLACIPISWHCPVSPAVVAAAALGALLIDWRSSGVQELVTSLHHAGDPPIIYLAVGDDEFSGLDALARGARGILHKSAAPDDVIKAIHVVLNGGIWAPRQTVVAAWFHQTRKQSSVAPAAPIADPGLTRRELEVLAHAAAGLRNRDVASVLTISEATVKAHLTSIFQKLGLRGRARLAAAYHGLVTSSPQRITGKHPSARAGLGRTTFGGVVRRPAN